MENVISPFKFLEPYGLKDAHLFFGREIETKVLLADILTTRLVVLFARTGTGKTSLINAGVRPALHARGYRTFLIRVSEDPVSAARSTLEEALGEPLPAAKSFPEQLKDLASQQPIVLFFDQFEEFFLYVAREDPTRARAFVTDVAEIAESDDGGSDVHVVFSMREEFLAEMEIFRDEIPTIFGADSNLRLRWFTRDQAAAAINRPLGAFPFNASAEPALVERIIDELSTIGLSMLGTNPEAPIEPAQLQMVCDTAWRARRDGTLTLERYLQLGQREDHKNVAEQILDQRLLEELEKFESEEDFDLLSRLLPELHTARGTKWVRELAELAQTVGTDEERLRTLLSPLRSSGLVDVVARKHAEFVELVHDYLAEPRRAESLRRAIRAIWPLRLLRRALDSLLQDAPLPAPDDLAKVMERVDEIPLSRREGEALLRWALRETTTDASRAVPAVERSGARVWQIFADQLGQAQEYETLHVLETLGWLEQPQAAELLFRALHGPQAMAERVVYVLGGIATTRSINLLQKGLERPAIRAQAQQALVRLVESWGERAAIGERAARMLQESVGTGEVSPEAEERLLWLAASGHAAVADRVLPLLAGIERVASVRALERRLEDPALAADASAALRQLRDSADPAVASAAAAALRDAPVPGSIHDEASAEPREQFQSPPSGQGVSTSDVDVFRLIAKRLLKGKVVPVLGAGVNLYERPPDAVFKPGHYLPSERELASALARNYPMIKTRDLAQVAQYIAALAGQGALYDELHDIFDADYPPTRLHRFLARMSRLTRTAGRGCMLFVTTNYDDALERAFADEGEPYELVTYIAQGKDRGRFRHFRADGKVTVIERPDKYNDLRLDRSPVIAKIHGSLDRHGNLDSFVITEDQYLDYLTRADVGGLFPVNVGMKLRASHFLFLGYSLRDWNLKVMLYRLWAEQQGMTFNSWAIQADPDPIDKYAWDERGVDVLPVSYEQFVAALEAEVEKLLRVESMESS